MWELNVCLSWKIKLAVSLKMGRGKERETLKFRLSVDSVAASIVTGREGSAPCNLLPNCIKMLLRSKWSAKSQALMPTKALLLLLHMFKSSEIQRNSQMHKPKGLQLCNITAHVGICSSSAFMGFTQPLEMPSLSPSCWSRQGLTALLEQMPEARVTNTWLIYKRKIFALD